jgi:hypothetical protein
VRRVRVVPAEGLQTVLPVHEDDGILARPEEVFGRGGSSSPCTEVVQEADAAKELLGSHLALRCRSHVVLQGHGRPAALDGQIRGLQQPGEALTVTRTTRLPACEWAVTNWRRPSTTSSKFAGGVCVPKKASAKGSLMGDASDRQRFSSGRSDYHAAATRSS